MHARGGGEVVLRMCTPNEKASVSYAVGFKEVKARQCAPRPYSRRRPDHLVRSQHQRAMSGFRTGTLN